MTDGKPEKRENHSEPANKLRVWGDDLRAPPVSGLRVPHVLSATPANGLRVPPELKALLATPGFLKYKHNGPGYRVRSLYVENSLDFHPQADLTPFGQSCYMGLLEEVIRMVESGKAPALDGTETAYEVGYASIVVWGSQRVQGITAPTQHLQVLEFLISRGVPVNQRDILWLTPVHHYLMNPAYERRNTLILELLLKSGAKPNAQDKLGAVPIIFAFEHNYVEAIQLLMDHAADLDIKDADGFSPTNSYVKYGPIVTASVQKGLRKRAGERMPREDKSCDQCRANDKPLKGCAGCHVARYCSIECQKAHWNEHKPTCRAFSSSAMVVVKPFYDNTMVFQSISDMARRVMGTQAHSSIRQSTEPKIQAPKIVIVKIQVPNEAKRSDNGSMLVYTKKRTEFTCLIKRLDNTQAYDRVYEVIKKKGVDGLKAYFSATIHKKDKLEIKISEVLAPQPF